MKNNQLKAVIFNVALAPYRIDFFNSISNIYADSTFYFLQKHVEGSNFNLEKLKKSCTFQPHFLRTYSIARRHFPRNIWKILQRENPDHVYVPEFSLTTILVLLHKKITHSTYKIIPICDDSIDMIQGNDFSCLHAYARRIITPYCDQLILLDHESCDWYQQHYGKGIWFPLIRNENHYLSQLESAKKQANILISKYQLTEKRVILFVGRLIALKNVVSIIQALQNIPEKFIFVIVGDGEERENLKQKAKQCGVPVLFTGWQTGIDLFAWYYLAHIFVLASKREPFGAVVNEALLAGCRVCVSKRAGSSCLVSDKNGSTFDPENIGQLQTCLYHELKTVSLQKKIKSLMPISYESCVEKLKNIL